MNGSTKRATASDTSAYGDSGHLIGGSGKPGQEKQDVPVGTAGGKPIQLDSDSGSIYYTAGPVEVAALIAVVIFAAAFFACQALAFGGPGAGGGGGGGGGGIW